MAELLKQAMNLLGHSLHWLSKSTMESTAVSLLILAALSVCQPINGLDPSQSAVIDVGESITLNCDPDNDFMTYTWSRQGTTLMDNAANLTITYNDKSSPDTIGGNYTCTANGTDDNNITFTRDKHFYVGLAPHISLPSSIYTTTGSNITFICEAVGLPTPNITWEADTGDIDEVAINNTIWSNLTISYVTAEDHGAYKCIADNGNTTDATATLYIIVSPDNVTTPLNQTVSYDSAAIFNCTAEGGPNNTFTWIKGNDISALDGLTVPLNITDGLNSSIVNNSYQLSLTNISGMAGGIYTCIVFNEAGYNTSSFTLYVSPEILVGPTDLFVEYDNSANLTCMADSYPPPSYLWQKRNSTTTMFEAIEGETNATLLFQTIQYDDYGEYRCNVTTTPMTTEVSSSVAMVTVSPFGSVTVLPKNHTVSIKVQASVNYTCEAKGGPDNTFHWYYNSTEILDNGSGNYTIIDDPMHSYSILTISYVGSEHNGSYVCNVSNAAGYDTSSAELIVVPIQSSTSISTSTMSTLLSSSIIITTSKASPFVSSDTPLSSIISTSETSLLPSPPTTTTSTTLPTSPLSSLSADISSPPSPSSTSMASPSSTIVSTPVDTPPTTNLDGKVSASTAVAIIVPVVIAPATVVAIVGSAIVVGLLKKNKLQKKPSRAYPKHRRRRNDSRRHIEMARQSYNQWNKKAPLTNETKFYGDKGKRVYK